VHALCAALVGEGKTELTAEEKADRKHEADLAVKALQQSVAAGLKYVNWLNNQDDFDILRDRPDFKELVVRIEEAVKADRLAQGASKANAEAKLKAQQEALAIRQKVAREDPGNTQAQMDLATTLQALGGVQSELSQTAEALQSVREALAIRQALLKADPKNLQRLVNVAAAEVALGTVEWNAGRYGDGARRWNQALARLDAAVQADPQDNWLLDQSAFQERVVATRSAEAGLWDAPARHLARVFERQSPYYEAEMWRLHASLRLLQGDEEGYRKHCAKMVERFGKSPSLHVRHNLATACLLGPKG